MRVAVFGADGMLGLALCELLPRQGREVAAFTRVDITDPEAVRAALEPVRPAAVVNCAAFTAVDACETQADLAFRVNALGARNVAAAAFAVGATIVHISTDYVFDGRQSRPYRETDPVQPESVYGHSKALGERLVQAVNPKAVILRTAWLYGPGGRNFVETMLRLAEGGGPIRVVDDQVGSPTYAVDLAALIARFLGGGRYGIYHATNSGSCSWHGFACEIFRLAGREDIVVGRQSTAELARAARRPANSVLEPWALRLEGLEPLRPWPEALRDYFAARSSWTSSSKPFFQV